MDTMDSVTRDDGIIAALLLRLSELRLPRLFGLQQKVRRGDPLNDYDIEFLNRVCQEVKQCHHFCKEHHEYDDLFCKMTHFFFEITKSALKNENRLH